MSAAVRAAEAGKTVVVLEKMPIVGGNINRATGGMNVAGTEYQKAQGITDYKRNLVCRYNEGWERP